MNDIVSFSSVDRVLTIASMVASAVLLLVGVMARFSKDELSLDRFLGIFFFPVLLPVGGYFFLNVFKHIFKMGVDFRRDA